MEIFDKSNPTVYIPNRERYNEMSYSRCGNSGVVLPKISLGLWHNFGFNDNFENARNILKKAFDLGITHFDLANNYGPPYGSAEENFGRILRKDFAPYRDELFIATKAGYDMWPGPYGNNGSKKYIVASLDQSLKRMGLDYVDVFYHHRPDPDTPLEETMIALDLLVRQGKALYVGISRYNAQDTKRAYSILKELGTPCLIHQDKYSMLDRDIEKEVLPTLKNLNVGSIVFSPLAQGILTNKYLKGIPESSRAAKTNTYLETSQVKKSIEKVRLLHNIAINRGQKVSQMAIAWLLRQNSITSILIGASSVEQLSENTESLKKLEFSSVEIEKINSILEN